jgi:DNA-binding transcriptional regulator YdaS (Cro superfamily)
VYRSVREMTTTPRAKKLVSTTASAASDVIRRLRSRRVNVTAETRPATRAPRIERATEGERDRKAREHRVGEGVGDERQLAQDDVDADHAGQHAEEDRLDQRPLQVRRLERVEQERPHGPVTIARSDASASDPAP